MAFNELPGAYLNWNVTSESLSAWLRYSVYRREQGDTGTGTRIAVINDPGLATYTDYTIPAGETWEYAVTQTILAGADEVESEFTAWIPVTPFFESAFLHDYRNPEYYVEIWPESLSTAIAQDVSWVGVWGRRAPTAYIGSGEQESYELRVTDDWESAADVWRAVRELYTRQREEGAVFVLRHERDVRIFCQIENPARQDNGVLYNKSVMLREAHVQEAV